MTRDATAAVGPQALEERVGEIDASGRAVGGEPPARVWKRQVVGKTLSSAAHAKGSAEHSRQNEREKMLAGKWCFVSKDFQSASWIGRLRRSPLANSRRGPSSVSLQQPIRPKSGLKYIQTNKSQTES